MPSISRNLKFEGMLLERMKDSFEKADEERNQVIHMTDLLNPRKGLLQRAVPLRSTDEDVLFFASGRSFEDIIGRIGDITVGEPRDFLGISYRPDFRWGKFIPTEFKSRRRNLAEPGTELTEYADYLDQLMAYAAADDQIFGKLLVFTTVQKTENEHRTKPAFATYDVIFSTEELEVKRQILGARVALFRAKLAEIRPGMPLEEVTKLVSDVPLCSAEWKCGKRITKIDKKAFCNECKKEIAHKPGHPHLVTPGVFQPALVHYEYEPRCKHWAICQPWLVDKNRGDKA